MLESLATAALGGALVLLGQLIPPIATHLLSEQKSEKALRRDKILEVIEVAYDVDRWMGSQKDHYLFDRDQNPDPSPIWKLRSLIAIHFPELGDELEAFRLKCGEYMVWATADAGQAKLKGDLQPAVDSYKAMFPSYHASFEALVSSALKLANDKPERMAPNDAAGS